MKMISEQESRREYVDSRIEDLLIILCPDDGDNVGFSGPDIALVREAIWKVLESWQYNLNVQKEPLYTKEDFYPEEEKDAIRVKLDKIERGTFSAKDVGRKVPA